MRAEWRLDMTPHGSSKTMREHLELVHERTGRRPKPLRDLDELPFPSELTYLLSFFWGFYSGQQFSYSEISAWCQFTGHTLCTWEANAIRQLFFLREAVRGDHG